MTAAFAVAIFVKTPGLSPVKTRLAASLGRDRAEEFYRLSVACIEEVVAAAEQICPIVPCWAVAETAALGDAIWSRFANLPQGDGDLGQRVDTVVSTLLEMGDAAIVLGADVPQLTPKLVATAAEALCAPDNGNQYVIGRCPDGGFYLYGSRREVPSRVWSAVRWSQPTTAGDLIHALDAGDSIAELPPLTDVDTADDLPRVRDALAALADRTGAQDRMLEWLSDQLSAM